MGKTSITQQSSSQGRKFYRQVDVIAEQLSTSQSEHLHQTDITVISFEQTPIQIGESIRSHAMYEN